MSFGRGWLFGAMINMLEETIREVKQIITTCVHRFDFSSFDLLINEYKSRPQVAAEIAKEVAYIAYNITTYPGGHIKKNRIPQLIAKYSCDKFKLLIEDYEPMLAIELVDRVGELGRNAKSITTITALIDVLSLPEYKSRPRVAVKIADGVAGIYWWHSEGVAAKPLMNLLSLSEYRSRPQVAAKIAQEVGETVHKAIDQQLALQLIDVYLTDDFQQLIRTHRTKVAEVIAFGIGEAVRQSWREGRRKEITLKILELIYKIRSYAADYTPRFDMHGCIELLKADVLPNVANQYFDNLGLIDILILHKIGLTPSKISSNKRKKRNISTLLKKITGYEKIKQSPDEYALLGVGAHGVVLLKERSAWKFSLNISEEYKLLKQVDDFHQGQQRSVVRVKGEPQERIAVELEHIAGDSLDNIVKQKGTLPADKVIKYAAGVMNGLIEIRQAGVWYHRDLKPANILIEENTGRAVIIDLGSATTDRSALPRGSRKFGPPRGEDFVANDLINLGQIMYYMAKGKHLFGPSMSMDKEFSSVAGRMLNDYKAQVYSDPTDRLLQQHLDQVDADFSDANDHDAKHVASLIKACITAKPYQYGKVKRMFYELMRQTND